MFSEVHFWEPGVARWTWRICKVYWASPQGGNCKCCVWWWLAIQRQLGQLNQGLSFYKAHCKGRCRPPSDTNARLLKWISCAAFLSKGVCEICAGMANWRGFICWCIFSCTEDMWGNSHSTGMHTWKAVCRCCTHYPGLINTPPASKCVWNVALF